MKKKIIASLFAMFIGGIAVYLLISIRRKAL